MQHSVGSFACALLLLVARGCCEEDLGLARVLVRGVQHREELFASSAGVVVQAIFRGDRAQAALRAQSERLKETNGKAILPTRCPPMTLHAVRFSMSGQQFAYEAVGLIDGPNPWQVCCLMEDPLALRSPGQRILSRTIWRSDGETLSMYDNKSIGSQGSVRSASQMRPVLNGLPLRRFLMLEVIPTVSFGEYLDFALSGGTSGKAKERLKGVKTVALGNQGTDQIDGAKCHRLSVLSERSSGGKVLREFWISPENGYCVLRFVERPLAGQGSSEGRVLVGRALRETAPGSQVWFASAVEEQIYSRTDGAFAWDTTTVTEVKELSAALEGAEQAASGAWRFPLACSVADYAVGQVYWEGGVGEPAIAEWQGKPPPPLDPIFAGVQGGGTGH